MQTLTSLTDYRSTNVYVMREKLKSRIADMRALRKKQLVDKVIQIPDYILRDEIKKALKLQKDNNEKIRLSEQLNFQFF